MDTVQSWPSVVPTFTPVKEVKPVSVVTTQGVASESSPVTDPSRSVYVIAKVLVEFVKTEEGTTRNVPLASSVKVVCATKPDCSPVAVSVYATPRSCLSGPYLVLANVPVASAMADSFFSFCVGSSCSTMEIFSPGCQPVPEMVTVSPGG